LAKTRLVKRGKGGSPCGKTHAFQRKGYECNRERNLAAGERDGIAFLRNHLLCERGVRRQEKKHHFTGEKGETFCDFKGGLFLEHFERREVPVLGETKGGRGTGKQTVKEKTVGIASGKGRLLALGGGERGLRLDVERGRKRDCFSTDPKRGKVEKNKAA